MLATGAPDGLDRKRQLREDLSLIRTQKAEVLTRIQALAKKARTAGGAPPPAASIEVRRAALAEEQRRRMDSLWAACSKIMVSLLGNQRTRQYFGAPVDATYAPGYYTVIKNPMDLGTAKTKLDQRRYPDIQAFREDVRLVFANCRTFNPPGNFVRNIGDQASEKFEKKWVASGIEAMAAAEIRRSELERQALEAEVSTLPDAVRAAGEELAALARKAEEGGSAGAPPAAPGPHRDMTFEEKRKLSHALGTLPGERLESVLSIIAEGPSRPQGDGGSDDYELDIDALDRETLWKLQSYVDAVAAELASKQPPVAANNGAAENGDAAKAEAGAAVDNGATADAHTDNTNEKNASSGSHNENEASEGVGSRGDDAGGERRVPHDPTTFVSATGPAPGQPGIVRSAAAGGKKEVQLQNPNAWAALTTTTGSGGGEAVPAAHAANDDEEEEEDNLWTEFQGRAQRADEERAAAEAAERAAVAEREEREREAQEAAKADLEAKRSADAARLQALEDDASRAREALGAATAAGAPAPDLAAVGLVARRGDSDDDDAGDDMEEL